VYFMDGVFVTFVLVACVCVRLCGWGGDCEHSMGLCLFHIGWEFSYVPLSVVKSGARGSVVG
jgi:hypothetical protein